MKVISDKTGGFMAWEPNGVPQPSLRPEHPELSLESKRLQISWQSWVLEVMSDSFSMHVFKAWVRDRHRLLGANQKTALCTGRNVSRMQTIHSPNPRALHHATLNRQRMGLQDFQTESPSSVTRKSSSSVTRTRFLNCDAVPRL